MGNDPQAALAALNLLALFAGALILGGLALLAQRWPK